MALRIDSIRALLYNLRNDRASLGTSTIVSQLSMLLFLFVLKLEMTSSDFAAFLVALSIGSIIGAAASLRSEVLITQADGHVYKRTLVWPIAIALIAVALTWFMRPGISAVFSADVTIYTTVLAFGFALQAICQFVLIQEARFSQLLRIRLGQAGLLALTASAAFFGMQSGWAGWGFALAMITPSSLWAIAWIIGRKQTNVPPYRLKTKQLSRGAILSVTILVNTAAVNIPIIVCAATQSSSYAADFGFLLKIFGAAATLANAMFGQLFMADNIRRDIAQPKEARVVRQNMHQTSAKAIGFVSVISITMIPAVFLFTVLVPEFLEHPILAVAIAIAILAQSGFSPVSAIGDIGKLESPFLLFYIARIVILYGLLMAVENIDYAVLFAILNLVIYSIFWLYADFRIRRLGQPLAEKP